MCLWIICLLLIVSFIWGNSLLPGTDSGALSNSVKELLLGVPHDILLTVGAVSEETAVAMAKGVRNLLHADLAVAVTGIAGPNADGTNKPVGLVYVAVVSESQTVVSENHFSGDREAVREQTIVKALQMVLQMI